MEKLLAPRVAYFKRIKGLVHDLQVNACADEIPSNMVMHNIQRDALEILNLTNLIRQMEVFDRLEPLEDDIDIEEIP